MRMAANERYDVVVAGAGNAALCAAMAAADEGASVLVLERAPEYLRGGNSFFTGGLFRFAYDGIEDIVGIIPEIGEEEREGIDVGRYTQAQFYDDLMRVTEGLSDPGASAGAGVAVVSGDEVDGRAGSTLDTGVRSAGVQARGLAALLGWSDRGGCGRGQRAN